MSLPFQVYNQRRSPRQRLELQPLGIGLHRTATYPLYTSRVSSPFPGAAQVTRLSQLRHFLCSSTPRGTPRAHVSRSKLRNCTIRPLRLIKLANLSLLVMRF